MLLLVTLHSVAVAVFAFEWIRNKICQVAEEKYSFIYLEQSERWKVKLYKQNINIISMNIKVFDIIKSVNAIHGLKPFALKKIKGKRKSFSFGKAIWLVWVLLFKAATKFEHPKGFASKFMTNVWAMLCLAFTASYTANLAAFMIIIEEFPNFKGLILNQYFNL